MSIQDIEQRIKKIIAEQLGVEESTIKSDTTFEDLGADSLDQVELVMALEDEFEIELSDEVAEKLTSLALAVEQVNKSLG